MRNLSTHFKENCNYLSLSLVLPPFPTLSPSSGKWGIETTRGRKGLTEGSLLPPWCVQWCSRPGRRSEGVLQQKTKHKNKQQYRLSIKNDEWTPFVDTIQPNCSESVILWTSNGCNCLQQYHQKTLFNCDTAMVFDLSWFRQLVHIVLFSRISRDPHNAQIQHTSLIW
mgnify:CR=1 FL=1